MKLIDLLRLMDDSAILNVYSATTLKLLDSYDGRNAIDECCNDLEITKITSENTNGIAVYVVD